jgi:carbon-monoxide dehydrogenase iron sulfur subunit
MITIDISLCSGCRRCEVHCSFFHSGKVGRSGARMKVVKIEDQGIDFPVVCQMCKERYCRRCPEKAIDIGELGQVIVSPTLCVACGTCEKKCPVGAIELYEEIPHVCDLCGGDPHCVKACTMGAISFDASIKEKISLKKFRTSKEVLGTEEKRTRFALEESRKLRDHWETKRRG